MMILLRGVVAVVFEQCQGANGTWVLWWRRAMAQNWYRGVIPFTSYRRLLMLFTFPHYSQPHCNHHHHCLDDQELLNLLTPEGSWVMRGIRQKQPPLSAREPHNCTLCTSWTFLHYYPQIVCCTCHLCSSSLQATYKVSNNNIHNTMNYIKYLKRRLRIVNKI